MPPASSPELSIAALEEALKTCAAEPIHRIGSIQPFGILLAAGRDDLVVQAASQNVDWLFPYSANDIIGQPLENVFGLSQLGAIRSLLQEPAWEGGRICFFEFEIGGSKRCFDGQVFLNDSLLIIEIEYSPAESGDVFHNLFVPIRDSLWKLDSESNLDRYAQLTVEQVRLLTGFERVMMYRFDANWDGEVIAESRIDTVDSYLGNRFPASDIPPQARALYVRNLVRVISDVSATPIPIVMAGQQSEPLDLSDSWLRSLSPVHIEYLRNMGVRASLSISLVQNGQLWGLIACHHFTPKHVGLRAREMDEFIGRIVSLKLINMDNREREQLQERIRNLLHELTDLIRSSKALDPAILIVKDQLLGLVHAAGAVMSIDGIRHTIGSVLPPALIDTLVERMRRMPVASVFATDTLGDLFEPGELKAHGAEDLSGMIVAPLDHRMDNFIMWFRQGILRTLHWAGNPKKMVVVDENGPRVSPRTSFATWIQSYNDKSPPWTRIEKDAASSLSLALIEVMAQRALKNSEESYRLLAENSTDVIARLSLDGVFRFASPACRDLFGLESTQMTGLKLSDVVEEPSDSALGLLDVLRPLGTQLTRVMRGRRPDKNELWVEATFKHTLGANGESEILINARNVTQRYNYQLAIEEVHRRHTKILEAAGEGLISLDIDGRIVFANEIAAKMLGCDEGFLAGKACCDLLCTEQSGLHASDCPFVATLKDGETRQGTYLAAANDGGLPVTMKYVCTPLVEESRITGCVMVFDEAGEHGTSSNALPTDIILDTAVEAVMLTDPQGKILSINRAFTEITGFSADEALGKTPRLLKSGVHTPHFYEEIWAQLEAKGRWAGEIWNRRKNGEIYPQWGSISSILGDHGEVKNYVSVFSDISKAKQAEERLYYLANHDSLTNLPNRMNFSQGLNQSLQRCKRNGSGAAVVFIDLDRFKIINDTLGHANGDKYLKLVSERLLASTRKNDMLGRWGGDEFVLIMEDCNDVGVINEMLERLLKNLSMPTLLGGQEVIPTASIGIALYPTDCHRPSELIKAADTAMYSAKQRGGNCIEFYSQEMSRNLVSKLQLTVELRHALQENQFFLAYQPQVSPTTGRLTGVEALARWKHPQRGVLPPSEFLPLIEEIGLLGELGLWALRESCRQMSEWQKQGIRIPKVSVNVAPVQISEQFVAEVDLAIHQFGIDARCLELEITEGALSSGEAAGNIMHKLRALGVQLAVDDFGTGYSSLSHLKMFPITCFKIDKSFVQGLPGNAADVAIVRTILALGASLQVSIVAEGVETDAQLAFLRDGQVDSIQGFIFSPALISDQLEDWLAARQA